MFIRTLLIPVAAIALGAAGVANAQVVVVADALPTERVPYGDLNLASDSGKSALENRIRRAAKKVCIWPGDPSLQNYMDGNTCYRASFSNGIDQMNLVLAGRAPSSITATATLIISAK